MPLPQPNTSWPPPHLEHVVADQQRYAAWWSGNPDVLAQVYGGTLNATAEKSWEPSWQRRGGLIGAIQRWFWGQPTPPGEQRTKLHLPIPREIAAVSADLLYGEPPSIKAKEDKTTQAVIDRLIDERAHTVLHEGAESGSALGATWLRVGIDRAIEPTGPLFSHVDADAVFPVFSYGRLRECTFLSEFEQNGVFWRHLEHHTAGLVEHALFCGDLRSLGVQMPLNAHSATDPLAGHITEQLDGRTGIRTGIDRVSVVGIPNARSIEWRRNPVAKDWGRPDIDGVLPELDAVDDVWTSWMRDIRHGRSRIHVPQSYLASQGPGQGGRLDLDKELYVGLNAMLGNDGGMELTATQFAIRWQEHDATGTALLKHVYGGAGYSPQTFGVGEESALTAAESFSRQVRTGWTRKAKIRRHRQGLREFVSLCLLYDREQFGGAGNPDVPLDVSFPETVQESQQSRAQTAQLWAAARAMSIDTLVRMAHPDWDEPQIQAEVDKISDEDAAAMPTPPGDPGGELDDLEHGGGKPPTPSTGKKPDDEKPPAGRPGAAKEDE